MKILQPYDFIEKILVLKNINFKNLDNLTAKTSTEKPIIFYSISNMPNDQRTDATKMSI